MSFLTSNIRFLRKQKGLTQAAFAEKIGVNRSVIGAYEENRADPRVKTLITIAHFFKIGLDDLLKKDLSDPKSSMGTFSPGQLRILPVVVDRNTNEELIPLIPDKAQAGYLNGFSDVEYIESLPKFSLPFPQLPTGRTCRMFQIEGDSMLPVPSKSYVIGSYVESLNELKEGLTYVFLHGEEGIVFKRLSSVNEDGLGLHSDNEAFEPYTVSKESILEIWRVHGYVSFDLPPPGSFQPEVRDMAKDIRLIKDQLAKMKKS